MIKVEKWINQGTKVEVEARSVKDAHKEIAKAFEAFNVPACGVCRTEDPIPSFREVDKFSYYEWTCRNPSCRARLSMGQGDDDNLYPRRRFNAKMTAVINGEVEEGAWIPNGGWEKYTPKKEDS